MSSQTAEARAADEKFMVQAHNLAGHSPHLGRKTSVIFVNSRGFVVAGSANDFPPGVKNKEERLQKPTCYLYIEHAERRAIAQCAKSGIALYGTTAYLPWFPCVECARSLVGAGIKRMVAVEPDWDDETYHFTDARQILAEGGVTIELFAGFEEK